jgi:hypothetical protein
MTGRARIAPPLCNPHARLEPSGVLVCELRRYLTADSGPDRMALRSVQIRERDAI